MAGNRKTQLKSDAFDKNITKRGMVPVSDKSKAKSGFKVGPMILGFFIFVVVGSAVLQIISQAQKGAPGM